MKKYLHSLIAVCLLAGISCQQETDIEKEKEAIIAVIEEEWDAWFKFDIDRLNAIWYQGASSRKIDVCKYCGTNEFIGWDDISKENKRMVIPTPEKIENRKKLTAQFTNYDINVFGNTALAYHESTWSGLRSGEPFHFEEHRILHFQKIDGEWKIDLLTHYTFPEEVTDEVTDEETDQ